MLRILFVAADAGARVADALRRGGLVFDSGCAGSATALQAALREEWSVIICDDGFPALSAFDALRITSSRRDIPVIVTSPVDDLQDAAALLSIGARDYVPFERLPLLPQIVVREVAAKRLPQFDGALVAPNDELRQREQELRMLALRNAAAASLGQLALSGVSMEELFAQSATFGRYLLQGEYAEVLERRPEGYRCTAACGDREHGIPEQPLEVSLVDFVVETHDALLIDDTRRERRFSVTNLERHGIRSGVAVPLKVGFAAPWGVLAVYSFTPGRFTMADADFLDAIAPVLGQAIRNDAARRALIESEENYRNVVDGASDIIFTVSPEGTILALNPAFESLTGHRVDEWIGRHFRDLIVDDDVSLAVELNAAMLRHQISASAELRIAGRERTLTVEVDAFPKVKDHAVTAIYGFARDVTASRMAEVERRKLEAKLEQAHRLSSLGRLAATVAHEFNNVLMGIFPFVEALRRNPSPERVSVALDHMTRSVSRGKRITEEILRFTQPAAPARVSLAASPWLQSLATEATTLLPDDIHLSFDVQENDLLLDADPGQLHQVMVNLILNARDAMPGGGRITVAAARPRADARFSFAAIDRPERFAHLMISDTGTGIAAAALRHIFEPLFTTKRSGTGLGLAVAHQIVLRHGGEIYVESEEGKGTTFHLFIPLALEEARAAEDDERLGGVRSR